MYKNSIDEAYYNKMMSGLKRMSYEYDLVLRQMNEYKARDNKKIINRLKKEGIAGLIVNSLYAKKQEKIWTPKFDSKDIINNVAPNYFSNHRIAVYTSLFGKYDKILEPISAPDNCDFYIYTDQELNEESIWEKVDLNPFSEVLANYSNTEKNRYFKMFPDVLFPEYEYSIYVDANILIISDLTEYVNQLGEYDIGMFRHPLYTCIYDECERCVNEKLITKDEGIKQESFLNRNNMPKDYGLLECCFIVRKHNSDICKKVMKEWWNLFINGPKRDQISFTYVLYKNKIPSCEVTLPGDALNSHRGLKRFVHRNK